MSKKTVTDHVDNESGVIRRVTTIENEGNFLFDPETRTVVEEITPGGILGIFDKTELVSDSSVVKKTT